MYIIAPIITVVGAVAYHYFIRKIPTSQNPFNAIFVIYCIVVGISLLIYPFINKNVILIKQITNISTNHIYVAISLLLLETGFLLMYRNGWSISTGNLTTSILINLSLLAIGYLYLGDKLSTTNIIGIIVCIAGVGMMTFKG